MDSRVKAIIFDEKEHTYTFEGRKLCGVTGAIGKIMGKSFPDTDTVKIATIYGSDVHKEVEDYYNHGKPTLSSIGAKWVVEELFRFEDKITDSSSQDKVVSVESEVMVSDFLATASKVDIVMRTLEGKAYLFDIKTTSKFDREYCSYQLSVYKRLYEQCYNEKVVGLYVLGTKSQRAFRIIEQSKEKVDRVLKINKELLGIKEEGNV